MSLVRTTLLALAALIAATSAHAQIAFRAATSASVTGPSTIVYGGQGNAASRSNCGTINPTIPAGTVAGNLLVAVVSSGTQPTLTMAGWNLLFFNAGANNHSAAIYWRIATGGDPTTIDQQNTCQSLIARISRFTGVDTQQPFQTAPVAAANWSYQNANSVTTGTQSVPYSGAMVVFTAHSTDDDTFGAEPGFTQAYNSTTTTGNDTAIALYYQSPATAPTYTAGPYNVTKNRGSDPNHGVAFALRPAGSVLTINVPAGTIANDVLIVSVAAVTQNTIVAAPAGWTALLNTAQPAANPSRLATFYRIATGTEPASYTFELNGSANGGAAGGMLAFSGVETTGAGPIDAQGSNVTASSLVPAANAVTTTVTDTMLVGAFEFTSSPTAANWNATGGQGMTKAVGPTSLAGPNNGGVALLMSYGAQSAAGSTGAKSATASGVTADAGAAHLIALRPVSPTLQWTMDQAVWNGTADEVVDASGNGLHGTSFNGAVTAGITPAIAGNPGTCRYGSFDGVDDYAQTADNALLDITDELTVMAWIRPTALPTGGNLKTIVSKDDNYEFHLDSAGRIYWWWGGGALELRSTGTVPLNAWTHVAIVYSRAGAFQRVYFNGVQDPATNNQSAALPTNNMPFQVGADQGSAGRQFPGLIDEVNVYRAALTAAGIQTIMNRTRPCVAAIDHFAISHAGSGIACVDQAITITAHDATHTAVDAGALLVNLSTTNARGSWTAILAGGGTLTDATPGDGAATYQFAPGSNSVQLAFRYANLAASSETFGFNVSGGGFSETTNAASGSDDPSFTMAQAGFQFRNVTDGNTTVPTQVSGKPSNTGFNARTLRIQAIRTDTVTGSCTGLFASQSRTVELGAECNSPATCAARQVSVNGTNIATSNDNGGAGAASYTGVSLAFNASSEADTVIAYPDAGQISLHARYDLDPLVAGFEAAGSSNAFVVRPFGLAFPGASHSSTAAGTLIGAAGDNFAMTVQAYQWASGEDANNDGIPDTGVDITGNGTVPNFAATAAVGVSANLPGVALGSVSRGAGCANPASVALAGGAGTAADWCYSEVGNVLLTADVTNYIAAGVNITGNSGLDGVAGGGYVGRFKPKSFVVTGAPTLTNRSDLACASTYTYMNEVLSLGFTLEARNARNALTQNYTGAYAKLNLASAAGLGIGARSSGGTNLTGRVDSSLAPTGSFANGSAALTAGTAITRAIPDNPDGPYTATQFGIAPNDNDPNAATGVQMQSFDQDVDGVGGNDHFAVAPTTELRFGRLRLANGYGPGTGSVQLPLDLQYWNGAGFALNTQDNCTTLARANIALSFTGVIAACDTAVLEANIAFTSGASLLTLAAPGAGKTGAVTLTPQLGAAAGTYCPAKGAATAAATASATAYLLGRWDDAANPDGNANTAYDDDPSGRAAFGLYGSQPKSFIFLRENY
jgi:hypothetical protein